LWIERRKEQWRRRGRGEYADDKPITVDTSEWGKYGRDQRIVCCSNLDVTTTTTPAGGRGRRRSQGALSSPVRSSNNSQSLDGPDACRRPDNPSRMSEGGSESELEYSRKSNSTMHSTQTQTAPQHIIPPALTSRRQRPPSLMPTAPPPAQALPPAPPISQSYPAQAVSNRTQNPAPGSAVQAHSPSVGYAPQNNVYSHPYSPHPYATNVNPQQHPSRDPNDAAYRATSYRQSLQQLYHSSRQPILANPQSPSPPSASNSSILSASVGLGITLPSTTPNGYSDQPLSSELSPRRLRDSRLGPTSSVPAGSYFAAYPSSSSRDRSNSATSHSSLGGRSVSGAVSPSLHSAANHLQSTDSISQIPPNSSHSQAGRSQRPSSRRALTAALELAKAAVQLDSTNEDPHGAVVAYARSVQLLGEVMERVMRGEDASSSGHAGTTDGEERRRGGRRRSVVAKEEEVRRLKAIVSTSVTNGSQTPETEYTE
jgi:hypothetical protein